MRHNGRQSAHKTHTLKTLCYLKKSLGRNVINCHQETSLSFLHQKQQLHSLYHLGLINGTDLDSASVSSQLGGGLTPTRQPCFSQETI